MAKRQSVGEIAANVALGEEEREVELTPQTVFTYRPLRAYTGKQLHFYGTNKTDQLHGATIAQMIRQGQGTVEETDLSNFDFSDGKDNGSLVGHPLSEVDWADPAERYESEISVKKDLVVEVTKGMNAAQAKAAVDKATAEKASAEQVSAEKTPSNA